MTALASAPEAIERFACFGGRCSVLVLGNGLGGTAEGASARARRRLQHWHRQFSRFEPTSELSRLNQDPRETVPVSPMMARFVEAAIWAAAMTGGLVDPTLTTEIERAGYETDLASDPIPFEEILRLAPPRRPAGPSQRAGWREVRVDRRASTVMRPSGVRLDSGGIAKGLFADILATVLDQHESFAVDAAGDLRFGGAAGVPRAIQVASPFDDSILHTFELTSGAAATSGISKRSWLGADGRVCHHLLDAATGDPAFTGITQVTALAPTGFAAEALAKAALLSGPDAAAGWLPHGGVLVDDDGSVLILPAVRTARGGAGLERELTAVAPPG